MSNMDCFSVCFLCLMLQGLDFSTGFEKSYIMMEDCNMCISAIDHA